MRTLSTSFTANKFGNPEFFAYLCIKKKKQDMALKKLTNNAPIEWAADDFCKTLGIIRDQIHEKIRALLERLGGSVYVRYYHDQPADIRRNAFFDIDDDGYGTELFLEQVTVMSDGEINVHLVDSEDSCDYLWNLSDFNATNSYYFLKELEAIAEWVSENGNEVASSWADVEDEDE